mgnify:CR=1 FL=1
MLELCRHSYDFNITNLDTPYGITYAGHTDDHFQRPLSDVYPDSYTEVRFLCPIDTID